MPRFSRPLQDQAMRVRRELKLNSVHVHMAVEETRLKTQMSKTPPNILESI